MRTDNSVFYDGDIETSEKHIEEWGKSSTPVMLTNDEWCMLTFYLTMSNKYIKRHIEIYKGMLRTEEFDGETYKEISDNASYLEGLLKSVAAMDEKISKEFTQNSMKNNKGA